MGLSVHCRCFFVLRPRAITGTSARRTRASTLVVTIATTPTMVCSTSTTTARRTITGTSAAASFLIFPTSQILGTDSRTPHGEDRHFGSRLVHSAGGDGKPVQLKGGIPMKRAGKLFDTLISDDNLLLAIDEVNRTHHWCKGHRPNTCTAWVEETKAQRVEDLRRILVGGFEPKKPHVSQR